MNKKIYLTKEGIEDLQNEYNELSKVRRAEVVERLAQARNMGDLSENAEYTAARDELSFIDGRIDELEELLQQAIPISNGHGKTNGKKIIELGSKVVVHRNGKKEEFVVVGEWEADPAMKKISHESPLGKALIGRQIGDKIEVTAPAGKILYSIVSIG